MNPQTSPPVTQHFPNVASGCNVGETSDVRTDGDIMSLPQFAGEHFKEAYVTACTNLKQDHLRCKL